MSADVGDPFGNIAALNWMRAELDFFRETESWAIDSYVWGVYPDIDFSAQEPDKEKAKKLFYESECGRAALEQLVELALDGNMIAGMQVFGGFGPPGSDDRKAVLEGMLRLSRSCGSIPPAA